MDLKLPKMRLFDYGNTLICEAGWNTLKGQMAVFEHVIKNPHNATAKDADEFALREYEYNLSQSRDECIEIHERQFMQLMYDYLGVEFDVPLEEIEEIFWNATSDGDIMPGADKMIDFINSLGIRSGVVSNIGFSGKLLTKRINRFLPNNKFEFILASSEYAYRKPHKMIFDIALKKANLPANDIWFCGDHTICDITGSHNMGMFPVRYDERCIENLWAGPKDISLSFDHLHINTWDEFIDILRSL